MSYVSTSVLIPSHSLDDFPTDCREVEAEGLLNAFAVSCHPALLAETGQLPRWDRADLPPEEFEERLFFVPSVSAKQLPTAWMRRATDDRATVIANVDRREDLISHLIEKAGCSLPPEVDQELVADFYALGICRLMLQLLTRHMHHFSEQDETHLEKKAVLAAQELLAGNPDETRKHLRVCFELLLEERERLYPVESHLVEICLMLPRLANEHFKKRLDNPSPFSLMVSASDLEEISTQSPELVATLKNRIAENNVDLVGGDFTENDEVLRPVTSSLWQLTKGHAVYEKLVGSGAKTWGRRKYGLSSNIPQLASRNGISAALLYALDDGTYPEEEQGKIEWEGRDGSMMNSVSRLPLSIDSAANMLRLAERLADSMNHDYVAMISLARWPEVKTPWLEDLYRISSYEPVLGRFITLGEFLSEGDHTGHVYSHDQREYLTPFLSQMVARKEANAVSRYSDFYSRREKLNAAQWCARITQLIQKRELSLIAELDEISDRLEQTGTGATADETAEFTRRIEESATKTLEAFSPVVLNNDASESPALLIVNTSSFDQTAVVEINHFETPPEMSGPDKNGPVKQVQFDDQHKLAVVTVPPCGFAVLSPGQSTASANSSEKTLAEELLLRNEFFELTISEKTGGIIQIKNYGRSPNRLSQQIAMRFADAKKDSTYDQNPAGTYSVMEAESIETTNTGPVLGQIVSKGVLKSPESEEVVANFTQTTSVYRGLRDIDVRLQIEPKKMPEGNPWLEYYCARFAWDSASAALSGGIQGNAFLLGHDRVEAPDYIEIADAERRMTIVPFGRPFHRRVGMRMLDSILIPAGETQQEFRFTLSFDELFPMHAVKRAMNPVQSLPTRGKPRGTNAGWLFHLSAKNVLLNRIMPAPASSHSETELDETTAGMSDRENGVILELMETEGRHQSLKLSCFRTPKSARQVNFLGEQLTSLQIEDGIIQVEAGPNEIMNIHVEFQN